MDGLGEETESESWEKGKVARRKEGKRMSQEKRRGQITFL